MITSSSNQKIKNVNELQTKSKARKQNLAFVCEGLKLFLEIPKEQIKEVYVSASFNGTKAEIAQVMEHLKGTDIVPETVDDKVFKEMSDTVTPQGVMCVAKRKLRDAEKIINESGEGAMVLVLERLQDPGNLGTILRTAEAAGAAAVLMTEGTVDIFSPKVVRSTMGSIFRVPFAYVSSIEEAAGLLKNAGFTTVATSLRAEGFEISDLKGARTAFFIGNESKGLSEEAQNLADRLIKIPMEGQIESLNAAVSAAVVMYQHKL